MHPEEIDDEGLGVDQGEIAGALLIDVRRSAAFAQSRQMLPGAIWRDPEMIADWSQDLDAGQEVVVYCVHGHEVSRNAARYLGAQGRKVGAQGRKARFLRGGFELWKNAGLPLADKPGVEP